MDTILVSGVSRGIGLELVRQYLGKGYRVLACCRSPSAASALSALTRDIDVYTLDVSNADSVAALAAKLAHVRIDILINNAGVMGGDSAAFPDVDIEAWKEAFAVNTLGPFLLTTALCDNLGYSPNPRVITVSSQMGAMTRPGKRAYAYRSTKAAVNKVMQLLAEDLKAQKIICCPVHPGWVKTDMGGANADISVEESVRGIIALTEGLTMADSGKFFSWTGEEHIW